VHCRHRVEDQVWKVQNPHTASQVPRVPGKDDLLRYVEKIIYTYNYFGSGPFWPNPYPTLRDRQDLDPRSPQT